VSAEKLPDAYVVAVAIGVAVSALGDAVGNVATVLGGIALILGVVALRLLHRRPADIHVHLTITPGGAVRSYSVEQEPVLL
jgi:hypothetical protein